MFLLIILCANNVTLLAQGCSILGPMIPFVRCTCWSSAAAQVGFSLWLSTGTFSNHLHLSLSDLTVFTFDHGAVVVVVNSSFTRTTSLAFRFCFDSSQRPPIWV